MRYGILQEVPEGMCLCDYFCLKHFGIDFNEELYGRRHVDEMSPDTKAKIGRWVRAGLLATTIAGAGYAAHNYAKKHQNKTRMDSIEAKKHGKPAPLIGN